MVSSIWCGLSPRPTDSEPCGSKSTSSTLRPYSASDAPRLIVVVVLPTPPFWLHIEMIRALRARADRAGLGEDRAAAVRSGRARPRTPRRVVTPEIVLDCSTVVGSSVRLLESG